jgi:hypothetical protein
MNLYIFIADALRWDYTPDLDVPGTPIKTVAASTNSPTSFATLTTGLHPWEHGVHTFIQEIDARRTYVDSVKRSVNPVNDLVIETRNFDINVFHNRDIVIERCLFTHAPYDDSKVPALEYLKLKSYDPVQLRDDYRSAANRVEKLFERRIDYLEANSMLDSTCVIFTSDHGELLGEYHAFSHSRPVVPELVYVPTVVYGQQLPQETLTSHQEVATFVRHYLTTGELDTELLTNNQMKACHYRLPAGYLMGGLNAGNFRDRLLRDRNVESYFVSDGRGEIIVNCGEIRSRIANLLHELIFTSPLLPKNLADLSNIGMKSRIMLSNKVGSNHREELEAFANKLCAQPRHIADICTSSEISSVMRQKLESLGYI